MKKQNLIFATVIAGVVAAAGTMIAVIAKAKEKKARIESERDAAGVEPIEEKEVSDSDDDDETEFTLSDDEDVVADGDVVVMDTPEKTEPEKTEETVSEDESSDSDDEVTEAL